MKAAWKRLSGNRFLPRSRKLSISSTRLSAVVPKYGCECYQGKDSCLGPGNLLLALSGSLSWFLKMHGNLTRKNIPAAGQETTHQLCHRKKKVREFPVPSRDVITKLSLGGNNDVITELFLPRGSLVSDIPAGDGKLVNLFYGV
jgi:hypothetical protein